MMTSLRHCCAILLGLAPLLAYAAADTSSEEEYLADIPVVVTVTRLPQKLAELPASVTVIDRQMIEASGALDIPDLLRLVAGFQIGRANTNGVRTTVTYHGNSDNYARRMQVLVDGRSVYNPATGGVSWEELPIQIEDIERIEVTRGPNGVAYGANAFLGVINIVSRDPNKTRGALIKHTVGEGGYERSYGRFGGRQGNFSYRASVYKVESGGLSDLDPSDGMQEVNDNTAIQGISLRGDLRGGINDYITTSFGYSQGTKQTGKSTDVSDPTRDRDVINHYEQLKWRHIISSTQEYSINFYHEQNNLTDYYSLGWLSDLLGIPSAIVPLALASKGLAPESDQIVHADLSVDTERTDLEFQHIFSPRNSWRIVWGGEARLDAMKAPSYLGTSDVFNNHTYRLFINNEFRPAPRWIINAGLLAEHDYRTSARFSPRIAVNRLFDNDRFLRMSYTTAYRTPAALEGRANFGIRTATGQLIDLLYKSPAAPVDEKIDSTELAFGGNDDTRRIRYEIKFFHERQKNLITPVKDTTYTDPVGNGAYLFENGGGATTHGAEVQMRIRPDSDTSISLAYSRSHTSGQLINNLSPSPSYLDLGETTPQSTLAMLASHRFGGGLLAGLGVYLIEPMKWSGGGSDMNDGVQAVDFTLKQPFGNRPRGGNIALTVRNLGTQYFDFSNYIYQEQSIYLSVALHL